MLQVKSNPNGFKVSAKRAIALVSAAAMSLFGLVATSTAANAAPVTKFSYANIQRSVMSDTFTLRANETLTANVSATLTSFESDGITPISTDHGVTPSISGVSYAQKSFYWTLTGCTPSNVYVATPTPCEDVTQVTFFVMQSITNETSSPITITANLSSAKVTYGSDEIETTQANISANKNISGNNPMLTSGPVITSDDRWVNGNIDVCLDDTLYSDGDSLTWEYSASINGVPLAEDFDMTNAYLEFRYAGSPLTSLTVADGQMTNLYLSVSGYNMGQAPGTLSVSVDLKKGSTSVLKVCPTGGDGPGPGLFPTGGASVSGTFSAGSKIKATPNTWSLSAGGVSVAATTRYVWYVCDVPLAASTTDFMDVDCFNSQPAQVLANGTSVGLTNGPNQSWTASELTITPALLTALTGKHLMVIILGSIGTPPSSKFGEVFMKSCGPIASGSSCSSTFGTAPVVVTPPAAPPAPKAKVTQKVPAIATTVKVNKTISFKKTTNAKLLMVVKNSTPKICKVAVKGANFTVTGLKPGNCKITLSQKGSATANPLKATVKTIKVVK